MRAIVRRFWRKNKTIWRGETWSGPFRFARLPLMTKAPPAIEQPRREAQVRCGGCGHACPLVEWRALPVVRTMSRVEVGAYVVRWPAECHVEVRACRACGRTIARTSRPLVSAS